MKVLIFCLFWAVVNCEVQVENAENDGRLGKTLPIFQVVRFPNDACTVSGGSKNGTCYTTEECSNKGGVNAGSCASGFGVCCTFTLGCGSTTSENCTYFDSPSTVNSGPCRAKICKINSNICQIRLDFNSFTITGPSTQTTTIGETLNGLFAISGKGVADATRCLTDTFTISNQHSVPVICGSNSGYHVYFQASDSCNSLDFQLGIQATGVSTIATRAWSIKVSQYSCDYENLAPTGCTQYFYGTGATNYIYSFNNGNRHLADQTQTVCVRRESGNCQICWSADSKSDVSLTGDTDKNSGYVKGSLCCAYGTKGTKIDNGGAYDCLMIPGAVSTKGTTPKPVSICGDSAGLVTATGMTSKTVCSKSYPFRITFHSDGYEMSAAAKDEATFTSGGFKLRYYQTSC